MLIAVFNKKTILNFYIFFDMSYFVKSSNGQNILMFANLYFSPEEIQSCWIPLSMANKTWL